MKEYRTVNVVFEKGQDPELIIVLVADVTGRYWPIELNVLAKDGWEFKCGLSGNRLLLERGVEEKDPKPAAYYCVICGAPECLINHCRPSPSPPLSPQGAK